jgi:hypothetical protein
MTSLFSRPQLLALLLMGTSVGRGQSIPDPVPKQQAIHPRAWRLVEVWWDAGKEHAFDSLALDVTISDDLPPKADFFLAAIGVGYLNETPFQGGLQSQAEIGARDGERPRPIGPGLIFTMPTERSLDSARAAAGGLRQGSGRKGDSVSVVRFSAWPKGKYTYKIKRADRQDLYGMPFTWVQASVVRHDKHDEVFLGSLRFPGDRLMLSRQLSSYVEIYTPGRPLAETPRLSVTLQNLQINGKPVENLTALAEYPDGVPDFAVARGDGKGILIALGQSVLNRKSRRVDLLPRADTPASQPRIGKFELLAIYTYARALRDGLTDNEAKERGITAAIMGARSRGLTRGSAGGNGNHEPLKSTAPKAKKKTLTADLFDQQVGLKLDPFFNELLLPRMKQLVETGLSYQKLKEVLEMPSDVGAKMSAEAFEQRASAYLKNVKKPQGS